MSKGIGSKSSLTVRGADCERSRKTSQRRMKVLNTGCAKWRRSRTRFAHAGGVRRITARHFVETQETLSGRKMSSAAPNSKIYASISSTRRRIGASRARMCSRSCSRRARSCSKEERFASITATSLETLTDLLTERERRNQPKCTSGSSTEISLGGAASLLALVQSIIWLPKTILIYPGGAEPLARRGGELVTFGHEDLGLTAAEGRRSRAD